MYFEYLSFAEPNWLLLTRSDGGFTNAAGILSYILFIFFLFAFGFYLITAVFLW